MSQEEPFPVHETVKVLQGITISKSNKWWSAALIIESYGRKQIALYLWNKRDDGTWRRKQKFTVPSKDNWEALKKAVDEKLFSSYAKP
jgi:hypothetical protein